MCYCWFSPLWLLAFALYIEVLLCVVSHSACPTLCDPMDFSLPGSSLYGILQARILAWTVILFSRGSSWPRGQTYISCITGRFFTIWATREAHIAWSVQFSRSVLSNSGTLRTTTYQPSLSITNSWSLFKVMSIELVMPSNHLILCCPLLLLPSIFPRIRVFSNESVFCIRWPKHWPSTSASVLPMNIQNWFPWCQGSNPSLPLTSNVTLGKLLNLFGSHFLCL